MYFIGPLIQYPIHLYWIYNIPQRHKRQPFTTKTAGQELPLSVARGAYRALTGPLAALTSHFSFVFQQGDNLLTRKRPRRETVLLKAFCQFNMSDRIATNDAVDRHTCETRCPKTFVNWMNTSQPFGKQRYIFDLLSSWKLIENIHPFKASP